MPINSIPESFSESRYRLPETVFASGDDASPVGSGTTSAADSYLLTAFAAVFLGSATLRDGEFHILGTLVGALIIAFGFNGLNIFGAPTYSQYVFQGAILIVAVGLSSLGRVLAES